MVEIAEYTTTKELAQIIGAKPVDIIKLCTRSGVFVSMNQKLDLDILQWITDEFKFPCQVLPDNIDIKGKYNYDTRI